MNNDVNNYFPFFLILVLISNVFSPQKKSLTSLFTKVKNDERSATDTALVPRQARVSERVMEPEHMDTGASLVNTDVNDLFPSFFLTLVPISNHFSPKKSHSLTFFFL